MADVDTTLISNRAATPRVANDPWTDAPLKRKGPGQMELSTSETAGAELRFFRIPSNAVVDALLMSCDAMTSGAVDVGLYRTDDDGGAVVDADFFASAQGIGSALTKSDITHESGVYGIDDRDKPIWEALGLSADPGIEYDVAGTVTTVPGAGGTMVLEMTFVEAGF